MNIFLIVMICVFVLLIAVGLSIANYASSELAERFKSTDSKKNSKGLKSLDFAMGINFAEFNSELKVAYTKGTLTDFYDPKKKQIALSESTLNSDSVASLAIISHELGHAMQDSISSKTFKRYQILRKVGRIVGFPMMPLLLIGIVLLLIGGEMLIPGISVACVAIILFMFSLFIKFYTIKMEKEASRIGMKFLKDVLTEKEIDMANKLLKGAVLTYWGDFFSALLSWTFLTKKNKFF